MMRSEFIERTKFEPTAKEYEEIEAEYMGTDIDKDEFCKQWKKNGGAERLMRLRARRIEELEIELSQRTKEYDELDKARCKQVEDIANRKNEQIKKLEMEVSVLNQTLEDAKTVKDEFKSRALEAERKLAVLKEAFAIITGKEAE